MYEPQSYKTMLRYHGMPFGQTTSAAKAGICLRLFSARVNAPLLSPRRLSPLRAGWICRLALSHGSRHGLNSYAPFRGSKTSHTPCRHSERSPVPDGTRRSEESLHCVFSHGLRHGLLSFAPPGLRSSGGTGDLRRCSRVGYRSRSFAKGGG